MHIRRVFNKLCCEMVPGLSQGLVFSGQVGLGGSSTPMTGNPYNPAMSPMIVYWVPWLVH